MIPKIIHYCWLSGDPLPADIQRCVDSWHEHLPDYELRLWDTHRFDVNATDWTRQAFERRKYAFAADYIRLHALYTEGGIYLDADVLVYKSFDDLLALPYFIGCDQIGAFEAAVIGAEKGCPWIADVLRHYDGRQFLRPDGSMDMQELPITFREELVARGYSFRKIHSIAEFMLPQNSQIDTDGRKAAASVYHPQNTRMGTEDKPVISVSTAGERKPPLSVFDGGFFNSRDQLGVRRTERSYCAHNYAGSWQGKGSSTPPLWSPKRWLPKRLANSLLELSHKTWNKHKYDWLTIPFEED